MRSIKYLLTLLLVVYPVTGKAQPEFMVGTSQISIEPDKSLISLHLGGYGAPREGRFTLQWINRESLSGVTAMTGISDRLYIIRNEDLLWKDLSDNSTGWNKAGKAQNIVSIAGKNDRMFAITCDGELLESKIGGKTKWKIASSVDKSARSLTISGNRLIAANIEGGLWSADLTKGSIIWSVFDPLEGVISLAADDRKLFALTDEGVIYRCEPEGSEIMWLKAAYKNNLTIKEDIRLIANTGHSLYGVSREGFLFEGGHRSEGNLTARAMAVKRGEQTVVMVTVDVCGLNDTYIGLLKQEIKEKHGLPSSAVFINSSHTHFAPVSQDWLTWQEANQRPDTVYLYSIVRNGILNAIDQALKNAAPAQLYFGRGSAVLGYNRSLKDHPELYDNSVDVIKVKYADSNTENYLFLAGCHPVFSTAGTLHYTISANYPGVARTLVERRTGTSNSLFLQGTAGDINPVDNGEYITGEKLSNEVIAVLNRSMTELTGSISFFLDTINIPIKKWTKDEIIAFREKNTAKPGDIYAEKNVKWCDLMIKYYREGTMPDELPVYVHTLNIGNWKLVGFSRETTTEYGLGVKNLWPGKMVSVAGYTNDVSSYLPTSLHIQARNYEGLESFSWYGMPAVFPLTVERTILNTIRSLDR